jgi:hypothetical protein
MRRSHVTSLTEAFVSDEHSTDTDTIYVRLSQGRSQRTSDNAFPKLLEGRKISAFESDHAIGDNEGIVLKWSPALALLFDTPSARTTL